MELLDLVKEVKQLDEDIKRQRREFDLRIKEQVKTHKSKKKELEKRLKESINSCEYEYKEVEVESFNSLNKREKIKIYYPFLKLENIYELKQILFVNEEGSDYEGLTYEYILYNKANKMEVKVREHSSIGGYAKGTNKIYKNYYDFEKKVVYASGFITYKIEIEGMKFEFSRSFDVSKI